MKFRIIQQVYDTADLQLEQMDPTKENIEWIVERKTFWGWREIMQKEVGSFRIPHASYADAEAYMIANYMRGNGWFRKDNNVYTYKQYTYNFPG